MAVAGVVFYVLFIHAIFAAAEEKVVEIPVLFRMDPQTNEATNLGLVNAFNETYKGKYHVEVQWLVETEAGYRNKIKQLNATDKLPAVITDIGFDDKFLKLLIENGRLVNLEPYIEDAPEWKAAIRKDIFDEMREEDQAIYVSPLGNLMYSSAGIVYNRELLQQAGYDRIPDNWKDFFMCLQNLKEEVRQGAVEFLKSRTLKDQEDIRKDMENSENSGDIMSVYKEQAWNVEELVPNYQINWEQGIINDFLTAYIPQLISGQITTNEFLHIMDETIADIG